MKRSGDQETGKRGQDARPAGVGGETPTGRGRPRALRRSAMPSYDVCIDIGGMPILLHTGSAEFARLLADRYGPFVLGAAVSASSLKQGPAAGGHRAMRRAERGKAPDRLAQGKGRHYDSERATSKFDFPVSNFEFPASSFQLEVELVPPSVVSDAEDARVRLEQGRWVMERGDFRAEWDPERRRGWVRESPNPYSIDSVLRILHSLILAREGGFLVHAASAIRKGRAFLFAGVSGAGKTTISRLAPQDVVVLTDEISYVRPREQGIGNREQATGNRDPATVNTEKGNKLGVQHNTRQRTDGPEPVASSPFPVPYSLFPAYEAFGTPFAGELARLGENRRAPVAALYLLAQGTGNRFEAISQAEAARALLRNILFFAQDEELVRLVSQSAFDFVSRVPVRRLVFAKDAGVWELIT